MPVITCIEDLRVLAERRVPRMFYDYADSGSWTESTYRANESDFQRSSCASAWRSTWRAAARARRWSASGGRHARGARADRLDRHAACRRRDPCGARGGEVRRPVHLVDHEHLLDRGRRRQHQQAVLVPALHDARPRLHRAADRARPGREVQRADAHAGPADPRPAPQGHQERPVGAAQTDAREPHQPGDQAALVPRHAGHPAAHLRQHRRPREGRRRSVVAGVVDRRAVRSRR